MEYTASPTPRRIPELDGLRVLLVFIVSWYHFWQQSWLTPRIGSVSLDFLVRSGYMPVDGTILLSGFLLFLPYARHMVLEEGLPDQRMFYRRRAKRIIPSYYFFTIVMLLGVALPYGLYSKPQTMVKDVFMHMTFTFTFNTETYTATPLGGSSWTLAIEMQAYLLFPYLARRATKHTASTLMGMVAAAWLFRGWCLWALSDFNMVVNQLSSFLDVYALGMALSLLYVHMTEWWKKARHKLCWEIAATAAIVMCFWGLIFVLKAQAASASYAEIQGGQMIRRPLLTALLGGVMVLLPFAIMPVRFLFGNRLMSFLSGISMNYYLVHQSLSVQLKRWGIPASKSDVPNQVSEQPWQMQYTLLCFGLAFLAAVLMTYCIEKPGGRLMQRWFDWREKRIQAE